jgi:Angiotensin-converting enzyme
MHAMPRPVLTLLAILACSATLVAQTASPSPTVAEARDFVDRVNSALLASSIESSRTAWVGRTYITDDTEILTATINARTIAQRNQFIAESHRFDSVKLPADLAREIMLLRTNARPAPSDPALRMTGVDHLDAAPMLEYFQPLYLWLKQQNALNGSKPGWQLAGGRAAEK